MRKRERYCVGACYRYLSMRSKSRYWYTEGGFLLYVRRILFPVFHFPEESYCLPLPPRLEKSVAEEGLHAVQGLAKDVELLETAFPGVVPLETIDYDLMELDHVWMIRNQDRTDSAAGTRAGVLLRIPGPEDINGLFPLQAGYDREEVLPRSAEFNPAVSLHNLQAIVSSGRILAAEYEGRLVGKININAESFTRLQIGGVYVDQACRGRGIGSAMIAEFIRRFGSGGKGFTLFVKKQNAAARRVYDRIGFTKLADYRIDYFMQ